MAIHKRKENPLDRIADALTHISHDYHRSLSATDFALFQVEGDSFMAINGVLVGSRGTFQIGFVPPNGVPLPSPPTVAVDDPKVTLGAVDGSNQFTADVAADDTATSFNLTVSGTNAAGAAISRTFNVPVLAPPPPQITDFTLDQVS